MGPWSRQTLHSFNDPKWNGEFYSTHIKGPSYVNMSLNQLNSIQLKWWHTMRDMGLGFQHMKFGEMKPIKYLIWNFAYNRDCFHSQDVKSWLKKKWMNKWIKVWIQSPVPLPLYSFVSESRGHFYNHNGSNELITLGKNLQICSFAFIKFLKLHLSVT